MGNTCDKISQNCAKFTGITKKKKYQEVEKNNTHFDNIKQSEQNGLIYQNIDANESVCLDETIETYDFDDVNTYE